MRTIYPGKKLILNMCLLMVVIAVISLILGELLIRTAIFMKIDSFCKPELYGDCFSDDHYWKLHHKWLKTCPPPDDIWRHPLLGWAPPKTESNPLGILKKGVYTTKKAYTIDPNRKAILCYGDSFMSGISATADTIPEHIGEFLPDYDFYNYGVGGYGVDQIYLRFKTTHQTFTRPVILIGILPEDIDRCALKVFLGQKPYFLVEKNKIVLRGVPITQNFEEWLEQNPPRIKSYLMAYIARRWRLLKAKGDYLKADYKRDKKKKINAYIIKEIVSEAQRHHLPLLFLILYGPEALVAKDDWREEFLKEQLDYWRVAYIDTKESLLQIAKEEKVDIAEFYIPYTEFGGGHLNKRGNEIVAKGIAGYIGNFFKKENQ